MKRRETDPASNQFPKCSPPSGIHRNSQSWVEYIDELASQQDERVDNTQI